MVRAAETQELDVHALLRHFVSTVRTGAPATYSTFREAWQKMKFSFIYEGCKERHLSQDYISWVLAAAADHFWAPLPTGPRNACSVKHTDAPAPAAPEFTGSEALAQHLPGAGEATEATQRPGCVAARPGSPVHQMPGASGLQDEAAPALHLTSEAAGASCPSPIAVGLPLDESSLLAMLMDTDEADALEPDQQILAALKLPSGAGASTAAAEDSDERPSFALKAGALYLIYTIHKTQPAYNGRRVRAYLPVSSLQAISDMLPEARQRQIPDVPSIVKCLVKEQAFVIGGVRRPPAGHQIVRDGPIRMAQVDMSERDAMQPMTMRHLANTQLALRELKHVQLLCDSYSNAQRSVFAAADPEDMPPSIADLGMGERFRDLARQITLDGHGVLSGDSAHVSRRQKAADQRAAKAGAAAAAADVQDGNIQTGWHLSPKEPARNMQAGLSEVDLGGLPSLAKAVVRRQGREQAEILARQQEWAERGARALAAAEDMPDDLALGHLARQEDLPARPPDAVLATAEAEQKRQQSEVPETAAIATRSAQDCSRLAPPKGLRNGSVRPAKGGREKANGLAGERTAAQAIACVFGEDSSSSKDDSDRPSMPVQQVHKHLEPPASEPGQSKALSRPSTTTEKKVQASKRHNRIGTMDCSKAHVHEAKVPPRAKRKAAVAESAADEAGGARPTRVSVTASKAAKSREMVGPRAPCSEGSSGKPAVKTASMCGHRMTKPSEKVDLDRMQADAVDWKAYADALDVRIAEAEALLADDSE